MWYSIHMVTNNPHYTVYDKNCPSRYVLALISDKWTALVVGSLEAGPRRFSELRREIDGISQKMLTQTLRDLEKNGIVHRTIYAEVPPRVEYRLTSLGKSLMQPLATIRSWSEAHIAEIQSARMTYESKNDGKTPTIPSG